MSLSIANKNTALVAKGGLKVMFWGNSLCENSYEPTYGTGGAVRIKRYNQRGAWHYARQAIPFPWHEIYHAGQGGTNTQEALARIDDILNAPVKPDVVWTILGGNELADGIDVMTQSIPTLQGMMDRFASVGILPICSIDWAPGGETTINRAQVDKFCWAMHYWCVTRGYPFLDLRTAMVRAETQIARVMAFSVSGSTITWTFGGHDFTLGDYLDISNSTEPALETVTGSVPASNIIDANTFETTDPSAGSITSGVATIKRVNTLNGKTIDGLHASVYGASDIGDYWSNLFNSWPMIGSKFLGVTNFDYENMVGAGSSTAELGIGNPMFVGSAGAFSGSPAGTGVVADGYTLSTLAGSTGGTITASKGTLPAPLEHIPTQIVKLESGGNKVTVSCLMATIIPGNWSPNAAVAVGAWSKPASGDLRLWLVCVTSGNTAAAGSGPVASESGTPVGSQITDGTVVWEVRRGFISGDRVLIGGQATIKSSSNGGVAEADGDLTSMCTSINCGLFESITSEKTNDIADLINSANTNAVGQVPPMRRRVGKTYTFSREGVIENSPLPAQLFVGFKFACAGGLNNSITVELSRMVFINLTALELAA